MTHLIIIYRPVVQSISLLGRTKLRTRYPYAANAYRTQGIVTKRSTGGFKHVHRIWCVLSVFYQLLDRCTCLRETARLALQRNLASRSASARLNICNVETDTPRMAMDREVAGLGTGLQRVGSRAGVGGGGDVLGCR